MNNIKNERKSIELFRKRLLERGNTNDYIEKQINLIFPLDGGFIERFNILDGYIDEFHKESILISGSAVGSELYIAAKKGYRRVYGTEVLELYNEVAKLRFEDYKNIIFTKIDGVSLPFDSEMFATIMSGHIIEHTMAPEKYLVEHIRVLKRCGYLYIEFPDRYNDIELHTNTKSFERFPLPIRELCLKFYSSRFSPEPENIAKYKSVLDSLLPISVKDIEKWLQKNKIKFKIIYNETPYQGVKRLIIKKL